MKIYVFDSIKGKYGVYDFIKDFEDYLLGIILTYTYHKNNNHMVLDYALILSYQLLNAFLHQKNDSKISNPPN